LEPDKLEKISQELFHMTPQPTPPGMSSATGPPEETPKSQRALRNRTIVKIFDTCDDPQTSTRQNDNNDQTPPSPKEPIHPTRTLEEQEQDDDNHKAAGLLTQLIEPKSKRHGTGPGTKSNTITEEFKQTLLNRITTLDRARAHKDSPHTSLKRGRILQKLQIKIQPLVVNRESPEFKLKWEQTLKNCKNRLMNLLIEHLDTAINKTKSDIRRGSNKCPESFKKTMPKHEAKLKLDEILKTAVKIHNENQAEAIKRKKEKPNQNHYRRYTSIQEDEKELNPFLTNYLVNCISILCI